jgi:hypothetical protein
MIHCLICPTGPAMLAQRQRNGDELCTCPRCGRQETISGSGMPIPRGEITMDPQPHYAGLEELDVIDEQDEIAALGPIPAATTEPEEEQSW